MADINHLARIFRERADYLEDQNESPEAYGTYRICADQVEEAWHNHAHDGSWYPEECSICRDEMAAEDAWDSGWDM